MQGTPDPLPVHLEALLAGLVDDDLLLRLTDAELSYRFKHALTQESAYQALLKRRRREIHRLVAEVYERLYPDRLDELAGRLADHFAEAEDLGKALAYAVRAGDAAACVYARTEAAGYYERALALAGRLPAGQLPPPPAGSPSLLAYLYLRRGRMLEQNGQFDAALANYAAMETLAQEREDGALGLAALIARARLRSTPTPAYRAEEGEQLLVAALAIAREQGNEPSQTEVLWSITLFQLFRGDPQAAAERGEEALALARRLGLVELRAQVLNALFMAYWPIGKAEQAAAALAEARELWRGLDNVPMLVENLYRTSLLHFMVGEYDQALAISDETYLLATSIGDTRGQANSRVMIGHVYWKRGLFSQAIAVMEDAVANGDQAGNPAAQIATRSDLGWVHGLLGQAGRGLALAQRAAEVAERTYPLLRPWAVATTARLLLLQGDVASAAAAARDSHRGLVIEGSFHAWVWVALADGELALAQGDPAQALDQADRLLEHLRAIRVNAHTGDALLLKSKALLRAGQTAEALATLDLARADAEANAERGSLWRILALEAEAAEQAADGERGLLLRAQAREHLAFVAANIGDIQLKRSFLAQADVDALLRSGPATSLDI